VITVPAGIVIGVASAAARVLSAGAGAAAVLDALEVSPPDPGVDVAAGWPAGAGSLLLLVLFPQAVKKKQRLAINGNANFLKSLGVTRFSPEIGVQWYLVQSIMANNCNRDCLRLLSKCLDSP
jgi:hypothetical protein